MRTTVTIAGIALIVAFAAPRESQADSGFYLGIGAGGATIEANLGPSAFPSLPSEIDEDDTAVKAFGGYYWDLPGVTLGLEAAYSDFGEPDIDVAGELLLIETTAVTIWGTAGFDVGPIDLYGKIGAVMWDTDAAFSGLSASTDGTDPGYGLGARFSAGPIEVRGEYEFHDLDGDDLVMLSLGIAYRF